MTKENKNCNCDKDCCGGCSVPSFKNNTENSILISNPEYKLNQITEKLIREIVRSEIELVLKERTIKNEY